MTDRKSSTQVEDVNAGASPASPSLGAIFDEHFDYVWNTLQRLGVREADLEDLAHEVFLKVHARMQDYDRARPIRPWLFGFAYRVASDHRRLARHRVEVFGPAPEAVDPTRSADESLEVREERALVAAALESVDFDRRAVLILHDAEEVPVPAIAEELGIPVNTAYSRLRVARSEFATAIKALRSSKAHAASAASNRRRAS
jgi:RNA polymerase sigma-70 factor (ECF subfamily)